MNDKVWWAAWYVGLVLFIVAGSAVLNFLVFPGAPMLAALALGVVWGVVGAYLYRVMVPPPWHP